MRRENAALHRAVTPSTPGEIEGIDDLRALVADAVAEGKPKDGEKARRTPSTKGRFLLSRARREIIRFLESDTTVVEALRMLAVVEEALLNHSDAIALMEKIIRITKKAERADIRKVSQLRQTVRRAAALGLSTEESASLSDYLTQASCAEMGLRETEGWLRIYKPDDVTQILTLIAAHDTHDDSGVIALLADD
jgi:hypothetical protein